MNMTHCFLKTIVYYVCLRTIFKVNIRFKKNGRLYCRWNWVSVYLYEFKNQLRWLYRLPERSNSHASEKKRACKLIHCAFRLLFHLPISLVNNLLRIFLEAKRDGSLALSMALVFFTAFLNTNQCYFHNQVILILCLESIVLCSKKCDVIIFSVTIFFCFLYFLFVVSSPVW